MGCSVNGAYPVQVSPSGSALIAEPEDITSPVTDMEPAPSESSYEVHYEIVFFFDFVELA